MHQQQLPVAGPAGDGTGKKQKFACAG